MQTMVHIQISLDFKELTFHFCLDNQGILSLSNSETQLTNFTYEEGPEGIFSAAFNFNKVRGAPIKLVRIDYAQLNNF